MLLKFSTIIFLITIQLFAEIPLTIHEQVKDNEQYKACSNIKDFPQRSKCEIEIEKHFIERGMDQFIQSFDQKYQGSVQNNISHLDMYMQGNLLNLYSKIAPLLDINHTPKELMKIKYNLVFYFVAKQNITGGCLASAKMIFQAAPELKNKYAELNVGPEVNVYTHIMNEATDYDEIANLSFENAQDYFDKLKIFLLKRKQDIKNAKLEWSDRLWISLDQAIKIAEGASDAIKKGDLQKAKRLLTYSYEISHRELDGLMYNDQLLADIDKIFTEKMNKHK
ncbi:MAG: hypothetical protein PHQ22_09170 [Sulfuricurvum sp.]|nr:hypothetical protein [Sulfuricurvum sp.]